MRNLNTPSLSENDNNNSWGLHYTWVPSNPVAGWWLAWTERSEGSPESEAKTPTELFPKDKPRADSVSLKTEVLVIEFPIV